MSALQVMIDGFLTAAELVALLFVSPVSAAERPSIEQTRGAPYERARDLHIVSTAFDVRLLGSLADVRVIQEFRNTSATTVTLARHLPTVDEHTDALRIHRKGRVFDLLQLGAGCGDDEEIDGEDLQADVTGHVQLAVDESIADALQLAPGEAASIELIATQQLSPSRNVTYRLALPALEGVESQALLIDQGDTRFLVVVPHRSAHGTASLTLRPDGAASETIDLGVLNEPSVAHIVPLANRAALRALAAGAIELETHTHDGIVWSTLPTHVRADSSLALVGATK